MVPTKQPKLPKSPTVQIHPSSIPLSSMDRATPYPARYTDFVSNNRTP